MEQEPEKITLADAIDPNAAWNRRRSTRLPHTCGFQNIVREIPRPDTCAECERQTHKDADGFVR